MELRLKIKFKNIINIIFRHIVLLVGIICLSIVAGFGWSYFIEKPVYQSQVQFLQTDNNTGQIDVYKQILGLQSFQSDVKKTLNKKNVDRYFKDTTISGISLTSSVNSPVFSVNVVANNPKYAAYVATVAANALSDYVSKYQSNVNISIVSKSKVPTAPITPSIKKIITLSVGSGLIIAILLIIIIEFYGKRASKYYLRDVFGIEYFGSLDLTNKRSKEV